MQPKDPESAVCATASRRSAARCPSRVALERAPNCTPRSRSKVHDRGGPDGASARYVRLIPPGGGVGRASVTVVPFRGAGFRDLLNRFVRQVISLLPACLCVQYADGESYSSISGTISRLRSRISATHTNSRPRTSRIAVPFVGLLQ